MTWFWMNAGKKITVTWRCLTFSMFYKMDKIIVIFIFACFQNVFCRNQNCNFSTFEVQRNFDISKYTGKWYEMQWLAQSYIPENELFRDYQHHYYLENDDNITVYIKGRDPKNLETCFSNEAQIFQTSIPGKMLFKRKINATAYIMSDYWVVMTDYDNYAIVYGCRKPFENGTCDEADSWIWSRKTTLSSTVWNLVNQKIKDLCLNSSLYLKTAQNNECGECRHKAFSVQKNFNLEKYTGKWYEMQWLAQSYIPENELFRDYQHHYYLENDGNITVYIKGRDPKNLETCFSYEAQIFPTDIPGKLLYKRKFNATAYIMSDYWVVMTDYDNYAIVYGCRKSFENGTCDEADSWIWSRRITLSSTVWNLVNKKIKDLCLNSSLYLKTVQDNECEECRYKLFDVQKNFNIENYTGKWYEMQWLAQSYIPENQLYRDYQHHYYLENDGNITVYIKGRDPKNLETCFNNEAQIFRTSIPGKMLFKRKINETAYIISDYWVVMTDYDNYAIVYGCRKSFENGTCDEADSWVWSRTPATLSMTEWFLVEQKISNLCVGASSYLKTAQDHECKECRFKLFSAQKDFDIAQYTGSWYEIQWLGQAEILGKDLFQDYHHSYVMENYGSLTVHVKGRDSRAAGKCFNHNARLFQTAVPGKFIYGRKTNDIARLTDYWVVLTDYKQYALVYGCRNSYSNGTCEEADSWIWSRNSSLPASIWDTINMKISDLCLNSSFYHATPQQNECPKTEDCPSVPTNCPTSRGCRVDLVLLRDPLIVMVTIFNIILNKVS